MSIVPYVFAALLVIPLGARAADPVPGEKVFTTKCQACHALKQVQGLLMPKPVVDRPAYLTKFLKGHVAILNEEEKKSVIDFLAGNDVQGESR